MPGSQLDSVVNYLRRVVGDPAILDATDAQLLERFRSLRDEAAFAALVRRHGRLVRSVCRNVLHHEQDTDDAFQATFVIFAAKAASIRKANAVASWLHGVAYRTAMNAKRTRKRHKQEPIESECKQGDQPVAAATLRELQAIVDEELNALPEKHRAPFILCCLEGKSRAEVCKQLGLKEGTLASRLERARNELQKRLTRRGVALSAVLCAFEVNRGGAAAVVGPMLVSRTIQAALAFAGGKAVTGDLLSTTAAALVKGVLASMAAAKLKIATALLLAIGLMTGAGVVAHQAFAPAWADVQQGEKPSAGPKAAVQSNLGLTKKGHVDIHGDPLPEGPIARLGTLRQRAPASQLALSADGKEIVAVDSKLLVRRFDVDTGKLLTMSQLSAKCSGPYRLSPKGTFVLIVAVAQPTGYQLELWDVNQDKRVHTLQLGEYSIEERIGMAFSLDENFAAITASNADRDQHKVVRWDLTTSKPRELWSLRKDVNNWYTGPAVALSPDGKRVTACGYDRILRCWDAGEGKLLWEAKRGDLWFMFFSPDGQHVVTSTDWLNNEEKGIVRWESATGLLVDEKAKPPKEAAFPFGYSPDGRFLAFHEEFGGLALWEPGTAKAAMRLPPPSSRRQNYSSGGSLETPTNLVFMPDGKGLIRLERILQRWDLATGTAVYADTEAWGHSQAVTQVLFSPDGKLIASCARDATARLWDVATGRSFHTLPASPSTLIKFTTDSRHLLAAPFIGERFDIILREWDLSTGLALRDFKWPTVDRSKAPFGDRDRQIRITDDGQRILALTGKVNSFGAASNLTTWDAKTGKCLVVCKEVSWSEDSLLTANGESVVAFDYSTGVVKLLNIHTGESRLQFQTDRLPRPVIGGPGCDLVMSPSGQLMSARLKFTNWKTNPDSGFDDIRIGDMATGRQLFKVKMSGPALSAFSADDRLMAIAGGSEIRFWETATWQEVGAVKLSPQREFVPGLISSLAFSPDGLTIATGHADSTILLWDISLRSGSRGGALTGDQIESLWADLAKPDAARAYAAVWRLADDPPRSAAFLKTRLEPVTAAPTETLRQLIDDLGSNEFKVRKTADEKLRALGEKAELAIREGLKSNTDLEKRQRLQAILAALESALPSAEDLRALRAVHVLERIGPAGRPTLERLATGMESARLTRAAKEALQRN